MTDREPPPWGNDSLSEFFRLADYNARVTAANYPAVFELLRHVDAAFKRAEDAVERDSGWVRLVPRFLLVRTHSSFLAAVRAGMSGQLSEAFALLRGAIEQSWYALHMAKDPSGDTRIEVWLRRNHDEQATGRCKAEFTVRNVRTTHEGLDPGAASQLHSIYESLIDYGAHPNQMGVLTGVTQQECAKQIDYKVGILYPAEVSVMVTLRLAVAVAIGSLKIFQLIYPERFVLMSLDADIVRLIDGLNSRFKQYSSRSRPPNTALHPTVAGES
jgi:hypothetical protein